MEEENTQKSSGALVASGANDGLEMSFDSQSLFPFSLPGSRKVSQLEEDLKKAHEKLEAAKLKEVALYRKTLVDYKEKLEAETKSRKRGWKKCSELGKMNTNLVELVSDLGAFLVAERKGGRKDVLKDVDLEILKGIPASLEPIIIMLNEAKSREDFEEYDGALVEVMKDFKHLQLKLRGTDGGAAEVNSEKMDDGQVENNLPEPATTPTSTEVEEHLVVNGVTVETADEEQEVNSRELMHAVNPKNPWKCLCRYTSRPNKVANHVWRLTKGRHTTRNGTFVCHVCGDRMMAKPNLKIHLACHQSPIPEARVDHSDSKGKARVAVKVVKPGRQKGSTKGNQSISGLPSSSGVRSNAQEQQFMEIVGGGQANVGEGVQKSRRSSASSPRKHDICLDNPYQCICGFRTRNVRNHINRLTVGRRLTSGSHVCEICGDRYRQRKGLNQHKMGHQTSLSKAGFTNMSGAVDRTETEDAAKENYGTPVEIENALPEPEVEEDLDVDVEIIGEVRRSRPSTSSASFLGRHRKRHQTPPPKPGFTKMIRRVFRTETTDVANENSMPVLTPQCSSSTPAISMPDTQTEEYSKNECPSCGERFPLKCRMWNHCVAAHGVTDPGIELPVECVHCQESFTTYHQYFDHQFAKHLLLN